LPCGKVSSYALARTHDLSRYQLRYASFFTYSLFVEATGIALRQSVELRSRANPRLIALPAALRLVFYVPFSFRNAYIIANATTNVKLFSPTKNYFIKN